MPRTSWESALQALVVIRSDALSLRSDLLPQVFDCWQTALFSKSNLGLKIARYEAELRQVLGTVSTDQTILLFSDHCCRTQNAPEIPEALGGHIKAHSSVGVSILHKLRRKKLGQNTVRPLPLRFAAGIIQKIAPRRAKQQRTLFGKNNLRTIKVKLPVLTA